MTTMLRALMEMRTPGGSPGTQVEDSASGAERVQELTASLAKLERQGTETYSQLTRSSQNWSVAAARAMTQVVSLLTRQNLIERQSASTHQFAEQAKTVSTLASLKQTAAYRAMAATAAGFEALGSFDFWAAAQDFASAALWGALAGTQIAAAASASHGGDRALSQHYTRNAGTQSNGSTGPAVSGLSSGAGSAMAGPSGNLTVVIMGDSEAGQWLAKTLNTAVEQHGAQLTATRSIGSAYAAG